jgi:hypothetical protein
MPGEAAGAAAGDATGDDDVAGKAAVATGFGTSVGFAAGAVVGAEGAQAASSAMPGDAARSFNRARRDVDGIGLPLLHVWIGPATPPVPPRIPHHRVLTDAR